MSENQGGASSYVAPAAVGVGGCGCLAMPAVMTGGIVFVIIYCGLGVLFFPIVVLILLFGGGGGSGDDGWDVDTDAVIDSVQGDGTGQLDPETVPDDLVDPIQNAGSICDAVGPVVIAAQIQRESQFNEDLVGPDGAEGISQLPPEKFDEFGEDDDDNDETSAFDAEDSIMAQGRYMCSLVEQLQGLVDRGEAPLNHSVLDLALAAYDAGIDAVLEAKAIPETNQSQGYVVGVRSLFPRFEGIGGAVPPDASPTGSPSTSPSQTP